MEIDDELKLCVSCWRSSPLAWLSAGSALARFRSDVAAPHRPVLPLAPLALRRAFYDKRISQEVEGDVLGEVRMPGG